MTNNHSKKDQLHQSNSTTRRASKLHKMQEINPNSIDEHYRHHHLRFVNANNICVGEVFKETERLAYCESVNIDNARQYCRQIVDERLSKQSLEKSYLKPDAQDLLEAMKAISPQIDKNFANLFKIHIQHKNRPISIETLKNQGGFNSTTAVFLNYAEWARLLCDALTYFPPSQPSGKDPYLGLVIQYTEPKINPDSDLCLSLMPDIYEALAQIIKL